MTMAAQQGLPVDLDGDHYRVDETLGAWKVTPCCGAFATGSMGATACRVCYADVGLNGFVDGPARLARVT